MLLKNRDSSGLRCTAEFLKNQIVPGTHVYQCPFCGEFSRKEKEFKEHLLLTCRRAPSSQSAAEAPKELHPERKSDDIVRCKRCGHVVKESQLAEHMRELHTTKAVADGSVADRPSAAEILQHEREILRLRAEQLDAEPSKTELNSLNPHNGLRRSVPCSCGGSNENCARCFGLGQIRDNGGQKKAVKYEYVPPKRKRRPRPSLVAKPLTPNPPPTRLPARPIGVKRETAGGSVQCLVCREVVRATVFGLHFSARHSRPHNLLHGKKKAEWTVCPICKINVKKLNKHMRSHEQKVVATAPIADVVSERERLIKLGHIVPQKEATVVAPPNPRRQGRKSKAKAVTTGRAGALERWKDELERQENPNVPKNLDYTKPYAHAYRENGRYGSHASHDGFDDESTS